MVEALRNTAENDASQLERLAARAEKMGPEGEAIAGKLRGLARSRLQFGS
jgi:hypothetical protein